MVYTHFKICFNLLSGYCFYLAKRVSKVNTYDCSHFSYGCHNYSYLSTRIYERKSCCSHHIPLIIYAYIWLTHTSNVDVNIRTCLYDCFTINRQDDEIPVPGIIKPNWNERFHNLYSFTYVHFVQRFTVNKRFVVLTKNIRLI